MVTGRLFGCAVEYGGQFWRLVEYEASSGADWGDLWRFPRHIKVVSHQLSDLEGSQPAQEDPPRVRIINIMSLKWRLEWWMYKLALFNRRSSVPAETPTSLATASSDALSGGSNRATALSLKPCPYRAASLSPFAPEEEVYRDKKTILTRGLSHDSGVHAGVL